MSVTSTPTPTVTTDRGSLPPGPQNPPEPAGQAVQSGPAGPAGPAGLAGQPDEPVDVVTLVSTTSTFAAEAGIDLRDRPAPLLRLLVLATLLAAPVRYEVAMRASRALRPFTRSARELSAAEPDDVSRALTTAGYWRFHHTKATLLVRMARDVVERSGGDLRTLYREATDPAELHRRLTAIPGVGPNAAHIVLREAQGVWPDVQPYLDARVLAGAARLSLPTDLDLLAATVPEDQLPRLAAACVRATLGPRRAVRA